MRVLFLSPRQCWPLDSGRCIREFHLAKAIAAKAELTILSFADPGRDKSGLSFCETITAPPPARYTIGKLLRGALTRTPLPVLNYTSTVMKRRLRELLADRKFDIVQVEFIGMSGYTSLFEGAPPPRIVYNWHDIESERMARYRDQAASSAKRIYAALTARRLRRVEKSILASVDVNLTCSEHDRQILAGFTPAARLAVIPNGVDVESFLETRSAESARARVLFVGAMNYDPNIQAVTYFARDLWPGIRQRFPDLEFTIVGSSPGAEVTALGSLPGVAVTGTVPDVRPYYAQAFAAVVPLLVGGGTRLKILEAMAAGVPVISTPIGAEGLAIKNGEDILLAETPPQWEQAFDRLAHPSARQAIIAAGLVLVKENYDWKGIGGKLIQLYESILSSGHQSN